MDKYKKHLNIRNNSKGEKLSGSQNNIFTEVNTEGSRSHAALVLIVDRTVAEDAIRLFNSNGLRNAECENLVIIEFPRTHDTETSGQLLHRLVGLISATAIENSLHQSQSDKEILPYVCGVGVNTRLFRWLCNNSFLLSNLRDEEKPRDLVVLSIVELSNRRYGYPNIDVVCAACHGTVDRRIDNDTFDTVLREIGEEARICLPQDELKRSNDWLPSNEELHCQMLSDTCIQYWKRKSKIQSDDQSVGVGLKSSSLYIYCRILPSKYKKVTVKDIIIQGNNRKMIFFQEEDINNDGDIIKLDKGISDLGLTTVVLTRNISEPYVEIYFKN